MIKCYKNALLRQRCLVLNYHRVTLKLVTFGRVTSTTIRDFLAKAKAPKEVPPTEDAPTTGGTRLPRETSPSPSESVDFDFLNDATEQSDPAEDFSFMDDPEDNAVIICEVDVTYRSALDQCRSRQFPRQGQAEPRNRPQIAPNSAEQSTRPLPPRRRRFPRMTRPAHGKRLTTQNAKHRGGWLRNPECKWVPSSRN